MGIVKTSLNIDKNLKDEALKIASKELGVRQFSTLVNVLLVEFVKKYKKEKEGK